MILAKNVINEMIDTYERAKEEYEKLVKELSNNDRETQDILHYIELEEFTSVVGISVALKLKELRVARRKIKDELVPLQIILSMLDRQKMDKIQQKIDIKIVQQENRHYTPRVTNGGLE